MAKPKNANPTLSEVMTGVDMVGTILDIELPRLSSQLKEMKEQLDSLAQPPVQGKPVDLAFLTESLNELREMMESQERQLAALDVRLARLAGEPRASDA